MEELHRQISEFENQLAASKSEHAILIEEMTSKYEIIEDLQNQVLQKEEEYEKIAQEIIERDNAIKEKDEIINKQDDDIREMKQKLEDVPEDVTVQVNVAENVVALEQT